MMLEKKVKIMDKKFKILMREDLSKRMESIGVPVEKATGPIISIHSRLDRGNYVVENEEENLIIRVNKQEDEFEITDVEKINYKVNGMTIKEM